MKAEEKRTMRNFRLKLFSGSSPAPQAVKTAAAIEADAAPAGPATAGSDLAVLGEALNLFEQDVTRIVQDISQDILNTRERSTSACDKLANVQGSMQTLVASSDQINHEIAGIAHSTDELSAAANEISTTVS